MKHSCPSRCQVVPGQWKLCARALGHPVQQRHQWVEALNRSDGAPMIVEWEGDVAEEPLVIGHVEIQSGLDAFARHQLGSL